MKILMIGGTHFIGRAAVTDLSARGHEVVVMNRGQRGEYPDAARSIRCDKDDRQSFGDVLKSDSWDAVIDTILSDEDLLFAFEHLSGRIQRFIHTGSIGVYITQAPVPASENSPLAAHDEVFNFNHKLKQDMVLMRLHGEHGFPGTSLRMSYIYGPGMVLLEGWGGRSAEYFRMLRDRQTILLANDGRALLHPGYVTDLARAFGDVLQSPQAIGQIYNIGGPYALMMRDYIGLIAKQLNVEPRIEYATPEEIAKRYPDQVDHRGLLFACEHMCCDIGKARQELGWQPTMSLETGLAKSIDWMREQGEL